MRVAQAFADSNYDFHKLVLELFSSPLVTGQDTTKTWRDVGETVSIARQDHFCAALTNRLGLATSLCTGITDKTTATAVANNVPLDGYLRGAEAPALSTSATPFFRGATESLCAYAAGLTIDKTNSRYDQHQEGRRDHRLRGEHHGHHVGRPDERHGHPAAQRPLRRGDGGGRHGDRRAEVDLHHRLSRRPPPSPSACRRTP